MTSRRTSSSLSGCCSADSASAGDPMATLLSFYGGQSCPRGARTRWPDVTRFVPFKGIRRHDAGRLRSGTLPIAEMSSTVRCTVMANRLSQACSYRSV